ncbi:MAG: ribonuclease PH [Firmicutes bacterium]|nr:ribonuclease PH [Bacillota bacterium]
MVRIDGRGPEDLRPVRIERNYLKYPEGSVLIEVGETRVICTATVEDKVPLWLRGSGQGWITAEYAMLPRATQQRNPRDVTRGKPSGRTVEIQRLVGRALRAVVDLSALGDRTIWIDCDVLQADGGTRTAAVTGAFVALVDALARLFPDQEVLPVYDFLAATSVGLLDGQPLLDLTYAEDARVQVDLNLVMTGRGRIVEIQGTAEGAPFSREEFQAMLAVAEKGLNELLLLQAEVLGENAARVGKWTHEKTRPGNEE